MASRRRHEHPGSGDTIPPSFPELPDGKYLVTLDKIAYATEKLNGSLAPGQTLNLASPIGRAQTATLHGTLLSSNNSTPAVGITVTVTDPEGTKSTISDSQGNYLVSGIVYGDNSVSFSGPQLLPKTVTGYLASGQAGVMNVSLDPVPITLRLTAPADGDFITTNPVTVTGIALNTDSVTVTTTNGQTVAGYPATVTNGTFSASVPLASGQTTIAVTANNKYAQSAQTPDITVNLAAFTVHNLGDTGNVTVMEVTGDFNADAADCLVYTPPREAIAKEYIRTHGDNYDFLVFLTDFDYAMSSPITRGFYLEVKNDTLGLGKILVDRSAAFGSAGRLQGTIDLGNVTSLAANPYGPALDGTIRDLNHEFMHRWGIHAVFRNGDGSINESLLGDGNLHWSYLLDTKGSLMYGNAWKDNGNGTFTSMGARTNYSPLDLYLMGMIPKEQVPPMLLIDNPSIDKTKLPEPGATIAGTAKSVTVQEIVAALGERVPGAAASQKQFKVGYVLLTRAGGGFPSALQAIETVRNGFAGRLRELTLGKAGIDDVAPAIEISIESPADGSTVTGPDVTVSGALINTTGAETGVTVNGMPAMVANGRFIANHVPMQTGANAITITATDANGLTTTSTRSVTAQPGNYIRLTTNIESGTAPLEVSLRVDGSFPVNSPTVSVAGSALMEWLPQTSQTEFSARVLTEGTMTFTVSAVGPDGQTYSDTVTVTAMSRAFVERLLQQKWARMKERIAALDVVGALGFIASKPQAKNREFFTALGTQLPLLNDYLKDIELVYMTDGFAKCRLYRDKTIMGQVYKIEYVIYFVQENGIWKLYQF